MILLATITDPIVLWTDDTRDTSEWSGGVKPITKLKKEGEL